MNAPDMTPELTPSPVFEPFCWVPREHVATALPADMALCLSGRAHDVAAGAATILMLLEQREIDADCTDEEGKPIAPMFSSVEAGYLQRMAIVSLEMLREAAENFHDTVLEHYPRTKRPTSQG